MDSKRSEVGIVVWPALTLLFAVLATWLFVYCTARETTPSLMRTPASVTHHRLVAPCSAVRATSVERRAGGV